ncbi:MAG: hypothetical protein HY704_08375 [Gemmatimonadetes bacterium]|nr:hypothetical protein [Gemmatimonadota bacterium]
MGLIAGEIERRGIATACLSCLEAVTEKVLPPRRLELPFGLGYPLGAAHDRALQTAILRRALDLLLQSGPGPVRAYWEGDT